MTERERTALEAPFRPEEIKQRDGGFGKKLDYLEGSSVIARLNDAFNGVWSCEILNHIIDRETSTVIVHVRLISGSVIKESFGSASIKRSRETGEVIDLGSVFKSATTDGVKKAATLLGVGLYLYGDFARNHQEQASPDNRRLAPAPHSQHRRVAQYEDASHYEHNDNVSGTSNGNDNGNNSRLSSKQHAYILKLAAGAGLTKSDMTSYCKQTFGVVLDFIDRRAASQLIDDLRNGGVELKAA